MQLVMCPKSRRARRGGPCQVHGCTHYAGALVRLCACCRDKLGQLEADRLRLAFKHRPFGEYSALESEALAKLNARAGA